MTILVDVVERFVACLLALDRVAAEALLREMSKASPPLRTVDRIVVPALDIIGVRWEQGSLSHSQVYMAGRICEELVDKILPDVTPERADQPTLALALLDDYHGLGKLMVRSVLRSAGYAFHDYGAMDAHEMASRVMEDGVDVLLISTLMLRSALQVRTVRDVLEAQGYGITIMVGGAPFRFDPNLWKEVGADAMGASASDAVVLISSLVGRSS